MGPLCVYMYICVLSMCLKTSFKSNTFTEGSSVHEIFQARVLEWGAIAFGGIRTNSDAGSFLAHCNTFSGPLKPAHLKQGLQIREIWKSVPLGRPWRCQTNWPMLAKELPKAFNFLQIKQSSPMQIWSGCLYVSSLAFSPNFFFWKVEAEIPLWLFAQDCLGK